MYAAKDTMPVAMTMPKLAGDITASPPARLPGGSSGSKGLYSVIVERMNGRVHRGTIESGQCAFYPCRCQRPKHAASAGPPKYRVKYQAKRNSACLCPPKSGRAKQPAENTIRNN